MALREIIVNLGVEVDKRALKQVDQVVDRTNNSVKKLVRASQVLGGIFATGLLIRGFKGLVSTASDANETLNKLGAVFGSELTPGLEQFSKRVSRIQNRSEIDIQKFVANAGALVKPLFDNDKLAAEVSMGIAQLTNDFSSFNDISPEDAFIKIKAAMVGTAEPLLAFGVDTRIAALNAFALSEGLTTQVKDMDASTLAALRYKAIVKGLGKTGAIGDAARTSDSYANALRGVQGAAKDLRAALGRLLLPAIEKVFKVLTPFIRRETPALVVQFKKVVDGTLGFARGLGKVWTMVSSRLGPSLSNLIGQIAEMITGVDNASGGSLPILVGAFEALLAVIGTSLEIVSSVIELWNDLDDTLQIVIASTIAIGVAMEIVKGLAIKSAVVSAIAWAKTSLIFKAVANVVGLVTLAFRALNKVAVINAVVTRAMGAATATTTFLMGGMASVTKVLTLATRGLSFAMVLLTSPIGLVILGIGLLIGLVVLWATKWKALPNAILGVMADVTKAILKFLQKILPISDDFIDNFTETLRGAWDNVIDAWVSSFTKFFDFVKKEVPFIGDLFGGDGPSLPTGGGGGGTIGSLANLVTDPLRAPGVGSVLAPAAGRGGGTSLVNSPNTEVNVTVQAQTNASAAEIGSMTSGMVKKAMEQINREAIQSFATGLGAQ